MFCQSEFDAAGRRTLFTVSVFAGYLLFGACCFYLIERESRNRTLDEGLRHVDRERATLLEVLWAETIARSEDDWKAVANDKLNLYEKAVKSKLDVDEEDPNPWTLTGSLFYAYTVATTIGYGNIYPTTTMGKLATIPYALVGIPLTLICLDDVGRLVVLIIRAALRRRFAPFLPANSADLPAGHALLFGLSLLLVQAVGLVLLASDWSLVDAVYFAFVSASTVGFGDLLPREATAGWPALLALIAVSLVALALVSRLVESVRRPLAVKLDELEANLARWRRDAFSAPKQQQQQVDGDARRTTRKTAILEEEEEEEED